MGSEVIMRPTVRLLALSSVLALAAALLAGCGQMTRPLHITYYYLPDAPESSEMRPAVEGLEKEFPGKVEAHGVDATSSEAQRMFRTLGFRTHGLVIHGRRGKNATN